MATFGSESVICVFALRVALCAPLAALDAPDARAHSAGRGQLRNGPFVSHKGHCVLSFASSAAVALWLHKRPQRRAASVCGARATRIQFGRRNCRHDCRRRLVRVQLGAAPRRAGRRARIHYRPSSDAKLPAARCRGVAGSGGPAPERWIESMAARAQINHCAQVSVGTRFCL